VAGSGCAKRTWEGGQAKHTEESSLCISQLIRVLTLHLSKLKRISHCRSVLLINC